MKKLFDQILSALRATGGKGMIIDEITSLLDIDTQTAADAIEKLLKEKRIKMEDARYLLQQDAMGDEAEKGKVGDLNGCPCFQCHKLLLCGVRQPDSPTKCKEMQYWMIASDQA
ncbi:MAG: hypothetical protein P1Q69_00705 [Candidatus Thorarchaeota archaeon]|nr:hypothetical protein [Candidatus Thorarchaeota archaeon]